MNNNYDDYSVSGASEDSSSYNNSEYYQYINIAIYIN